VWLVISCERPEVTTPDTHTTIASELQAGWQAYAAGEYDSAIVHFTIAALRDAAEAEAYNGLAWSYLRKEDFTQALSQFSFVVNLAEDEGLDSFLVDAYAGQALLWETKRFSDELEGADPADLMDYLNKATMYGEKALSLDPQYQTSHDPDFDATALTAMLARDYYYQHWYSAAYAKLNQLGLVDPSALESAGVMLDTGEVEVVPVLNNETGELTATPFTIPYTYGAGEARAQVDSLDGFIYINDITDLNGEGISPTIIIRNSNRLEFPTTDDLDYAEATETVTAFVLQYPGPTGASVPYVFCALSKGGVFQIEKVEVKKAYVQTIYQADTSYQDTVYQFEDYTGTVNVFDFPSGYPDDADSTFQNSFKFNYVNFADEDQTAEGTVFRITYRYGWFKLQYTRTDSFGKYLSFLSTRL